MSDEVHREVWLDADAEGYLGTFQTVPVDPDHPRLHCYVHATEHDRVKAQRDEALEALRLLRDQFLLHGDPDEGIERWETEAAKIVNAAIAAAEADHE